MNTYIDCIPCLYRQTIDASRIAGLTDSRTKTVIDQVGKVIACQSLDLSPPELAEKIHKIIKQESGEEDVYREIKQHSITMALTAYSGCKDKIKQSDEPLLTAVELAIAGNVIDFGAKNSVDVESEIGKMLRKEEAMVKNADSSYFAYESFQEHLEKSKQIIYLGDNAGETVFDRILIEEILREYPKKRLYYTVKETPIINDAVKEDAVASGIDITAPVISSGSTLPGTVLEKCSEEFLYIYNQSDMVISKGQGNFESFTDPEKPVFYLFMAKCPTVAKLTASPIGAINLLFNQ
ncbi:MAG: damage-control phosphatase ARMT1 family protein [Spirochaetia bacterium]